MEFDVETLFDDGSVRTHLREELDQLKLKRVKIGELEDELYLYIDIPEDAKKQGFLAETKSPHMEVWFEADNNQLKLGDIKFQDDEVIFHHGLMSPEGCARYVRDNVLAGIVEGIKKNE